MELEMAVARLLFSAFVGTPLPEASCGVGRRQASPAGWQAEGKGEEERMHPLQKGLGSLADSSL